MEQHKLEYIDPNNLQDYIKKLKAEKEHALTLLHACMTENEELKAKVRELEARRVADTLCEELVLLEEDMAFVSSLVKPVEVDHYTSNAGRVKSPRSAASPPSSADTGSSSGPESPAKSASEQLLERNLLQTPPHHRPLQGSLSRLDEGGAREDEEE